MPSLERYRRADGPRLGEAFDLDTDSDVPDVVAERGPLRIRRMRDDDADHERMVRWRNSPHVREWWDPDDPPLTVERSREEYGPLTRPESPTVAAIMELDARPIGYIQFHPWAPYEDELEDLGIEVALPEGSWGLDVFIGEADCVGRGLGTQMVDLLCRHLFDDEDARAVALWAAQDNHRALRAYEKAGFHRDGEVLDTDTRDGERVRSWVLVRAR